MLQRLEGGDPTLPPSYQLKTSGPLLTSHLSDIRLYFTGTNATMPNHSYPGNSKTALKAVIEVQMKYTWCKTNVKHISFISSSFPNIVKYAAEFPTAWRRSDGGHTLKSVPLSNPPQLRFPPTVILSD